MINNLLEDYRWHKGYAKTFKEHRYIPFFFEVSFLYHEIIFYIKKKICHYKGHLYQEECISVENGISEITCKKCGESYRTYWC
jgi:hypothetical protein